MLKFNIEWLQYSNKYYIYGSDIEFKEDKRVIFKNNLMPPGTPIVSWSSKTTDLNDKLKGNLPYLKKNHKYKFIASMTSFPKDSVYIQLEFWDKYEEKILLEVFSTDKIEIVYPSNAHTYSISIMSRGSLNLEFKKIFIEEIN